MIVSRSRALAALATSVIVMLAATPVQSADAALSSCGANGSTFDGDGYYRSGYEGVAAVITVRNSALCTSVTNSTYNFSYTWSMLAAYDGVSGYSQSGYYHGYGKAVQFAVEDNPTGTATLRRKYISGAQIGANYEFLVQYSSGCHCMEEMVGGVIEQTSNFNPYTSWSRPFSAEWYGETKYPGSDLSGTNSARSTFSSMDLDDTVDGFIGHAYVNDGSTSHRNSGRTSFSNNSFAIWQG